MECNMKLNEIKEMQNELNEKLEQFQCPDGWKLMFNEKNEIVLCNNQQTKKSENKTYYIPKVFANHTSLSNDDIETIISINENKLDYGWIK